MKNFSFNPTKKRSLPVFIIKIKNAILLLVLLFCLAFHAFPQIIEYPLIKNEPYDIAISGNWAITMEFDDDGVFFVNVFQYNGTGWHKTATLFPNGILSIPQVAISGNTIALEGWDDNSSKWFVITYAYQNGNWAETARIELPNGYRFSTFSYDISVKSISIDGNWIIASTYDTNSSTQQGHILLYKKVGTQWQQVYDKKDLFGTHDPFGSVALSGNRFIVSDTKGQRALVYAYNGTQWLKSAELTGNGQKSFFYTIDLDQNRIVANSRFGYCTVYEYQSSQWVQTAQLTPSEGTLPDMAILSMPVAVSGNLVAFISQKSAVYHTYLITVFEYDGSEWHERANIDYPHVSYIDLSGRNLMTADNYWGSFASSTSVFMLDDFSNPQEQKIVAPDGKPLAAFGESVAVSGNDAIIGAPSDSEKGNDAGAAYVYERNGVSWDQVGKFTASDAAIADQFGLSVDINENRYAVVGAPFDDDQGEASGSAYIFLYDYRTNKWKESAKITAPDGAPGDHFGYSVAIDLGTIVISAPNHSINGKKNAGAIYLYEYNGLFQKKLVSEIPKKGDLFGSSVDILPVSGVGAPYKILVGAPFDDDKAFNAGAVYIFNTTKGWNQQKIYASDAGEEDRFGMSVSLYDNRIIIGAPMQSGIASQAGAAYIFKENNATWTQEAKLTASDAAINDRFGRAVAIDNVKAIVGASYADLSGIGTNAGAVYVYKLENGQWNEKGKLTGKARTGDRLGYSVATNGNQIIAGAYHDDHPGLKDAGSAYIFNIFNLEDLPMSASPIARTTQQEEGVKKDEQTNASIKNPLTGIRELKVYPNPFVDRFSIELDKENQDQVEVTLLDQLGRTLYKNSFSAAQGQQLLDVDIAKAKSVPSGIVVLGLKTRQGESKWFRLLKQ